MRARTKEFLYLLLWTAEFFSRPSIQHLGESFEGWAYRRGFMQDLRRLERDKFLERNPNWRRGTHPIRTLERLTEQGRIKAMGGRDPEERWRRGWDGQWRLVIYDVPQKKASLRDKLRCFLGRCGFGYLQHSVWVTPDPIAEIRASLKKGPADVGSLVCFNGRPEAGESDTEIACVAWDFAQINEGYKHYEAVLRRRPRGALHSKENCDAFFQWLEEERAAWCAALRPDPLLPACLLPEGYAGRRMWEERRDAMREVGAQMEAEKK